MREMSNPILGISAGLLFTALVQSSAATIGIVIVLASQGAITLEAGIAIVLGANIGTCVTALLAALGKPAAAKQTAAAHILFNVLGVLIWLPFIGQLASMAESVSPVSANLSGTAQMAADTPRQIANAHTLFNVANTMIFISIIGPFSRLVEWLIPEKPEPLPEYAQPVYLDDSLLNTPALAIERIRLEAVHFGGYVDRLIEMTRTVVLSGGSYDLDIVVSRGNELRRLHDAITDYARRLLTSELTSEETRRLEALVTVIANIDHVAETIAVNMVSIGRERLERRFTLSRETIARFQPFTSRVRESYQLAIKALDEKDAEAAAAVMDMKAEVDRMSQEMVEYLSVRLLSDDPDRAVLYRVESRLVELIQRIYYFSSVIAAEILKESQSAEEARARYDMAS